MLFEQLRETATGRVAVQTREPEVGRLLEAILGEWRYPTGAGPARVSVALVESGLETPAGTDHVLWLSPRPLGEQPHLLVPLSLTDLHHALQPWLFTRPRRFLRLASNLPARLERNTVSLDGQLLSLSERGGRIACYASLPIGELWQLNAELCGYPLRLSAEVIYIIPPGDVPGREQSQYGLQFKSLPGDLGLAVRRYVERTLVERACARAGLAMDDPAVGWFDTVANPWAGLAD